MREKINTMKKFVLEKTNKINQGLTSLFKKQKQIIVSKIKWEALLYKL